MTKPYSVAFKQKMVQRLTGKNAVSASELSRETGVRQQNLSRWLDDARSLPLVASEKIRAREWTVEQKVRVCGWLTSRPGGSRSKREAEPLPRRQSAFGSWSVNWPERRRRWRRPRRFSLSKKSGELLRGGRGRRHERGERQMMLSAVAEAQAGGARLAQACRVIGLSTRTIERWRNEPERDDARRGPHHRPHNALSPAEEAQVVSVLTSSRYAGLSPKQLVPQLADEGLYLASESTIHRVQRRYGLRAQKRVQSRTHVTRACTVHRATGPNQVWSWDITWLPTTVRGAYLRLYLVMDVWSRRIVGWRVSEREVRRTGSRARCAGLPRRQRRAGPRASFRQRCANARKRDDRDTAVAWSCTVLQSASCLRRQPLLGGAFPNAEVYASLSSFAIC